MKNDTSPSQSKNRFVRLLLPMLGALLCCVSGSANAQSAFSIDLRAVVSGGFSLETTQLDFGKIVPGVTQTVLPEAATMQGTAGRVTMTFNTDGLTVSMPADMTLIGPGAQIHATLTCAATPTKDSQNSTRFPCANGFSFVQDGSNRPVIYVGGVVSAAETVGKPSGTYTGEVVVTARSTTT